MERIVWYRRLAAARRLLEAAGARFAEMTDGVEHPRVTTARDRLEGARTTVIAAAGGLGAWRRTGLSAVLLGAGGWSVAAAARWVFGLPAGWTIALTASVMAIALPDPASWALNRVASIVDRRRTAGPAGPPSLNVPVEVSPVAEVLALVRMARHELSTAACERSASLRYGDVRVTASGFDWLRVRDRPLDLAVRADRHLCVVVDAIEIWLADREVES